MYDRSVTRTEFWRKETRKARKNYHCFDCKDPILKGTSYTYIVGKWDAQNFSDCRVCDQCEADWVTLIEIENESDPTNPTNNCIVYGVLGDLIVEAFDKGWIDKDNPLAKRWMPKDWLQDLSDEGKDEIPVGRADPLQMPLF